MRLFGKQIAPADLALALAGVLGTVCFFWLLPAQHPHAATDYRLGADEATAEARALLEENGYPVEDFQTRARFRPNDALLRSLQQTLGRPPTVDTLQRAPEGGGLPAYGWRVHWLGEDFRASGNELDDVLSVSLDEQGRLWNLSRELDQGKRAPGVNREALAAALPASEGTDPLAPLPDSVLTRYLQFERTFQQKARQKNGPADSAETALLPQIRALTQRTGGKVFTVPSLDREAAVRLARYHLRRSALAGLGLRADSVWTDEDQPRRRAHIRFASEKPTWEQHVEATMTVTSVGALRSLDTEFEAASSAGTRSSTEAGAEEEDGSNPNAITLSAENVTEVTIYVTYGVLFLIIAVLFFRRLSARAIDAQAALRDALWGGLFAGAGMGLLAANEMLHSVSNLWFGVGLLALIAFIFGLGGALLIFVLSSSADSLAREVWPEKVESLSLVRRFSLRNVPVGAALLRGGALAGLLVGLATLTLLVFPQAALRLEDTGGAFLHSITPSPFAFLFAEYGWISLVYMLLVLLAGGTLLYRWKENAALAAGGVVAVFVLSQAGPYALAPVGYSFALAGALGTVLTAAFWRYDALTCFTGYLLMGLVWGTAPGWMIDGFPEQLDFFLALLTVAAALGVGFVGVWSGRTGEEAGSYTPAYLEELAEQQRLQRDIEIAQQVQRDFLPRRMPQVEGLDVAALCLPAREVGGDYYDFINLGGGRLGVVIGDVSGKGIEASFYMTLVKGFLQTLAQEERSPAEVLRRLNALFCKNAPRGIFITMTYGVVDPAAGTFRFARAGHNPLVHRRMARAEDEEAASSRPTSANGRPEAPTEGAAPEGTAHLLRPRGMAIGLVEGPRFDDVLDEVTLPFGPGDALVLYTDGFPEARGASGKEFGEERLLERIQRRGHVPARQLLQTLADDVHAFVEAAGRHDDMTMVIVKHTGAAHGEHPPHAAGKTLARRST